MLLASSLLLGLRRLLHGSDRERAIVDERVAIDAHLSQCTRVESDLREAFGHEAGRSIEIGDAMEFGWKLRLPLSRLGAHVLLVGPSGSGKSRLAALILKGLFDAGHRRAVVLDPKAETVDLAKAAIVLVARALSSPDRLTLYRSMVEVDLFGTNSLPKLNILASQPGLDPEAHAFDIATLLTTELDQGVGVRQEVLIHRAIECLIRAELPITVLPTVLEAPALLDRLAECCGPSELFRSLASRLKRESKERVLGLQSRAERVLRLRATRLALGASDCIDGGELLDVVSLVSLAAPQGAQDVSRMLAGLLWLLLSHAIRRRANGAARSHLIVDEFPTFLASGGARMADGFEDLLRLARSKGVFLTALTQDIASISKVSGSLTEVLRQNVHLLGIFRAATDSSWDFVLPITGGRPKPRAAPWEEERGGVLDRAAETTYLRQELVRLPDRQLFLVDRRTGLPGVRLRTADFTIDAQPDELEELECATRAHRMLAPVAELERQHEAVMRRVDQLLGRVETLAADDEARRPVRKARGKLDVG